MNDPDEYNWIDPDGGGSINRGTINSESSSSSNSSLQWYLMMDHRFQQASFITQMFDMILSAVVFIFALIAVWALRKNRRLSLLAAVVGAVHALGRCVYFAVAPVDTATAIDGVLASSTILEFIFMAFWTIILVLFGWNLDKTVSQRSAVRPMHPEKSRGTTESVPNVREQRKQDNYCSSSTEHTSGYVPSRSPKPSDEYLMNPISPSLDIYSFSKSPSVSPSIKQDEASSKKSVKLSVLKECFDALRIDGKSRLRFSACSVCAGLTIISFTASIVYTVVFHGKDAVMHRVTLATFVLCIVRSVLWSVLELSYLVLSVRVLGNSREGLLFASNRKSPLRASCAAMLVMTLKAATTPWDHLFAPVGVVVTGLDVDYCAFAWYILLIFDELIPLAYMLFVLSRVTISSIKKSRRNRILRKSPRSSLEYYGSFSSLGSSSASSSMDSFGSIQNLSSGDLNSVIVPSAISVPVPPAHLRFAETPVDFSQGALLMNANLSLSDARPVSDECFAASLESVLRLSSSVSSSSPSTSQM